MQKEIYDAVVVGAGIVGCSVSYHLAKSGFKVALLDKGSVAGEASQAAAGMLAPLDDELADQEHPLQQLGMAALGYYSGLDEQLKQETGIDIGLADIPTLRPAFDEHDVTRLQALLLKYRYLLPELQWLDRRQAQEVEPMLPETVQGALLSPYEKNVQPALVTQAYARGAALHGTRLVEGCSTGQLIGQGKRVTGVETAQGPIYAEAIVLAAGAWMTQWHKKTSAPPVFPVKGQMMALQAPADLALRHTVYAYGVGGIVPKSDGTIYVGATAEEAGFDKTVTAGGIATLLDAVAKLTPSLSRARFVRTWAGLRPASADELPLIGASQSARGLWIAGGHFRDGILLGSLTGYIMAELIQKHIAPFGLNIQAFDPTASAAGRVKEENSRLIC